MSTSAKHSNKKNTQKSDIEDLFGFDYEINRDSRSQYHKGKHSYKSNELLRIHYIKERKEKQKENQAMDSIVKFHEKIKNPFEAPKKDD